MRDDTDHSSAARGTDLRRRANTALLLVSTLVLAACLGALSDILFWTQPEWPGGRWWYLAVIALLMASALGVNRGVRHRSSLDRIRVSRSLDTVDILVVGVSAQTTGGPPTNLPLAWNPGSIRAVRLVEGHLEVDTIVSREGTIGTTRVDQSVGDEPASADVFRRLQTVAGGSNWAVQLRIIADALDGGELRAILFACSEQSAEQLDALREPFLENLLRDHDVVLDRCVVDMFDVRHSFVTVEARLEALRRRLKKSGRLPRKPNVVFDSNGGTGQYSVAAALLSMKKHQAFTYKKLADGDDDGFRVYDMEAAQRSALIPGADA